MTVQKMTRGEASLQPMQLTPEEAAQIDRSLKEGTAKPNLELRRLRGSTTTRPGQMSDKIAMWVAAGAIMGCLLCLITLAVMFVISCLDDVSSFGILFQSVWRPPWKTSSRQALQWWPFCRF